MGKCKKRCFSGVFMVIALFIVSECWAGSSEIETNMFLELKRLIEQQQKQLDHQAKEIAALKEQLGGASKAIEQKANKEDSVALKTVEVVNSKSKNVDVSLYGHVNRGILWSENGDSSKVSFVDNSNSQSRIGVNASVSPMEGLSVGGKIEYGVKSNASYDISQNETNDATSVNWNLRHADIFFISDSFGKVSLGHGSAASDGTSEIDLSGTNVVSYSDVNAISGGQLFYDSNTEVLSDLRVKNVFDNMDGLGRDDRLRYDTPEFAGMTLSGSAVSGDVYDAAFRYSRIFGETKVAAGIGYAKLGDVNESVTDQYSGSASLLLGNGLNVTVAGAFREMSDDGRDDSTFWFTKLGYRADIFDLGKTSFSIDYAQQDDLNQNGDESTTWAIAAVQDMPSWGTEFYLAYRNYKLERAGTSFEEVNAILGGARVKF